MGKHAKGGGRGRTNFENHDLDDMIDLVESARPSDMIGVAAALGPVSQQIAQAGQELIDHLDGVEWEGESAKAFRSWAKDLAKNTLKLGEYAAAVGKEMDNVGIGLTTIQKSMPSRADGKGTEVKKIPTPAQVTTSDAYVKAKAADDAKREAARQEAINEMNKLSSYYRMSEEQLEVASRDAPVFKPPQDVGVPRPPRGGRGAEYGSVTEPGASAGSAPGPHVTSPSARRTDVASVPDHEVGTDLDSVALPQAPSPEPSLRPTTPSGGPSPLPGGTGPMQPGPLGPGVIQSPEAVRKASRFTPGGRSGAVGQNSQMGRVPQSITGRPNPGGTGPVGMGSGRSTAPGTARAGRPDGVVGGTPQRSADRRTAGHLPRGTVIGGERGTSGQGGVGSAGAANRRLTSSPGGAVGTPRAANGRSRGTKDFTPGGTGLVRGAKAQSDTNGAVSSPRTSAVRRDPERDGTKRPDYLSEDQATWTSRRRDIVPPVID
ncbi:hypothetical protein ABT381_23465 [Streptomyces sp. NPDC000151]|uniref:hypothetical protein n=1 Tax=Streptomyces sp. NPDC000151 TaxID=3154244 RepID=UPI0033187D63